MDNIDLYGDIYRCEDCSRFTDPIGVMPFAGRGPNQTVPVSHFGDITTAKIWLVLTNPKGDRNDRNVGHLVSNYGVPNRSSFTDNDAHRIQDHFNRYFHQSDIHAFFARHIRMLDGLELFNHRLTFQNGGICAVDVIKCPTISDWQRYVRTGEGKDVWCNCLGRVRTPGPNHFFLRQLNFHKPAVLIFTQSTHTLVSAGVRGAPNGRLMHFASNRHISHVFLSEQKEQVSVSLCKTRMLNQCLDSVKETQNLHQSIQTIVNAVFNGR